MNKQKPTLEIFIKDHLLIIGIGIIWLVLLAIAINFQEITGLTIVMTFTVIIWFSIRENYIRYLKYGNRQNLDQLPKRKPNEFEFITEGLKKYRIPTFYGTIKYQFIVDSNGKLIDPKIISCPGSVDESLILKIIEDNRDWMPGLKKNIPVSYFYVGGFRFDIDKNGSISLSGIKDTKNNMANIET